MTRVVAVQALRKARLSMVRARKKGCEKAPKAALMRLSIRYGGGRLVLRPSGTEPVVRVTVEADDAALMQQVLDRLAEVVRAAA